MLKTDNFVLDPAVCLLNKQWRPGSEKFAAAERVGEDPSRTSGDLDNFQMEEEEKEGLTEE